MDNEELNGRVHCGQLGCLLLFNARLKILVTLTEEHKKRTAHFECEIRFCCRIILLTKYQIVCFFNFVTLKKHFGI